MAQNQPSARYRSAAGFPILWDVRSLSASVLVLLLAALVVPTSAGDDPAGPASLEERLAGLAVRTGARAVLLPAVVHALGRQEAGLPGQPGAFDRALARRLTARPELRPVVRDLLQRYRRLPRATLEVAFDRTWLGRPLERSLSAEELWGLLAPFRGLRPGGAGLPGLPSPAASPGPSLATPRLRVEVDRNILSRALLRPLDLRTLAPRIDRVSTPQPVDPRVATWLEGFFLHGDEVRLDGYDRRRVETLGVVAIAGTLKLGFMVPGWAAPGPHVVQVLRLDASGAIVSRSNRFALQVGTGQATRRLDRLEPARLHGGEVLTVVGRFLPSDLILLDGARLPTAPGTHWQPGPAEWVGTLRAVIAETTAPGEHRVAVASADGQVTPALPLTVLPPRRPVVVLTIPRLRCVDETNPEKIGVGPLEKNLHDEVFLVVVTEIDGSVAVKTTRTYSGFDDGDEQVLDAADAQVVGAGGAAVDVRRHLRFYVAAYEDDGIRGSIASAYAQLAAQVAEAMGDALRDTRHPVLESLADAAGRLLDELVTFLGGADFIGDDAREWTASELLALAGTGPRSESLRLLYNGNRHGDTGEYAVDLTLVARQGTP